VFYDRKTHCGGSALIRPTRRYENYHRTTSGSDIEKNIGIPPLRATFRPRCFNSIKQDSGYSRLKFYIKRQKR